MAVDWNEWREIALDADDVEQVAEALAHGADAKPRPGDGSQTALFWARFRGSVELVRLLIQAGATIASDQLSAPTGRDNRAQAAGLGWRIAEEPSPERAK
jgi:ankyrin repeat protein